MLVLSGYLPEMRFASSTHSLAGRSVGRSLTSFLLHSDIV